jgi:hypothetical protein
MARRLTVAEQLAAEEKDFLLDRIADQSDWSQFLVMQAALAFGQEHDTFSCNQLRDVLPELGHGFLGAAINALRQGGILQHTGKYVPSTSPATHGHPIALWRLSVKGLLIAEQRRSRAQQARPAA